MPPKHKAGGCDCCACLVFYDDFDRDDDDDLGADWDERTGDMDIVGDDVRPTALDSMSICTTPAPGTGRYYVEIEYARFGSWPNEMGAVIAYTDDLNYLYMRVWHDNTYPVSGYIEVREVISGVDTQIDIDACGTGDIGGYTASASVCYDPSSKQITAQVGIIGSTVTDIAQGNSTNTMTGRKGGLICQTWDMSGGPNYIEWDTFGIALGRGDCGWCNNPA